MTQTLARPAATDAAACWITIGVRGDMSCPQLETYIHCRNCKVYTATAGKLLDCAPPPDYTAHWTRQIAQASAVEAQDTQSVVLVRIGAEWLALPTAVLKEIAALRPIHSIPHRRDATVLGVVNIRGELLVCISLARLLGIESDAERREGEGRRANARLLILERAGARMVSPVDEVHGVQRVRPLDREPVPATVAKAVGTCTRAVFRWEEKSVGLLDDQTLFQAVDRILA